MVNDCHLLAKELKYVSFVWVGHAGNRATGGVSLGLGRFGIGFLKSGWKTLSLDVLAARIDSSLCLYLPEKRSGLHAGEQT